jgi:hypothetical protein
VQAGGTLHDHDAIVAYRRGLEPVFGHVHDVNEQVLDELLLQQEVDVVDVLRGTRPSPVIELLEECAVCAIYVDEKAGGVAAAA